MQETRLSLAKRKKFMKFNDFLKKTKPTPRLAPRFVLQNDAAMVKYQAQIRDLDTQLGYYRNIEAERDDAFRRLNSSQETTVAIQHDLAKTNDALADSQRLVEHQEQQLNKIPTLEEDVRAANGKFSQVDTELQNLTRVAFGQSQTISTLGAQLDIVKSEIVESNDEAKQARSDKISLVAELEQISTENLEFKNFADDTSKINIKLRNELHELRDTAVFWEKESIEALVQLKESGALEGMLRKWISDLEMKDSQINTQKGNLNTEVTSLQNTVTEMSSVIEDMMKEMIYLRTVNKDYRRELAKPRFASMGAIARREGFVMPTGQENLRKHYLGNSAPTLLKFKGQEEMSHA